MKYDTDLVNAHFWPIVRVIELAALLSTGAAIWREYGLRATMRYLFGFALALMAQRVFLASMIRRIGVNRVSLADVMTLSRGATSAVLAGLFTSGIRDREGLAGKLGWSLILLEATAIDWLDGPLARKLGPSRLGAVMDIEADSWLTLWSGISAVAWGELPRWCLLPPILRYLDPLLDVSRGKKNLIGGYWDHAFGHENSSLRSE